MALRAATSCIRRQSIPSLLPFPRSLDLRFRRSPSPTLQSFTPYSHYQSGDQSILLSWFFSLCDEKDSGIRLLWILFYFGLSSTGSCLWAGFTHLIRAVHEATADPVNPKKNDEELLSPPNWKIKMLYDGDCPLCMREVCSFRQFLLKLV